MTLPSQRWLRVVVLATGLVFVGVLVYIYAFRFFAWGDSDAAVPVVLGARALDAKLPVVADWYYANGDIWVFGPQLLAMVPVAILGVGPASLLVTVLLGFVLQLVGFVWSYLRLGGELWLAVFAALVTSMAWSNAHAAYGYVQLSYGLVTCFYAVTFTLLAGLAETPSPRSSRFALTALLIVMVAVQNPTRTIVYVVGPLLVACAWPWRTFSLRKRALIAAVTVGAALLAYLIYKLVLVPSVELSYPRGHVSVVIGNLTRIKANLVMLGRGLELLCAGHGSSVRAIPGILLIVGAVTLVGREVFTSRALTALRFVSVIVFAQLGAVLVLLVVSNLLTDKESARYLMPCLLASTGLGVVLAVRTLAETGNLWRRLSIGWLIAIPIAAAVAAPDASPPAQRKYVRPDAPELARVAAALEDRGLTHGFAINIAANWIAMHTHGTAITCPVHFRHVIFPHHWLADTRCFDESQIPERFFVVVDQAEPERAALRTTLPPELERFTVGDTYEVYVYRRAGASFAWLDLPVRDGELATFPMRLAAAHLQLVPSEATVSGTELNATGNEGTVVYGPYIELPKGRYTATWIGRRVESPGNLEFKVTANGRNLVPPTFHAAAQLPAQRGELTRVSFVIGPRRSNIEFPVTSGGGARVSLHELVIEKAP